MSKKPNPELIDDENPKWTTEQIVRARPASEMLPQIFGVQLAKEMLKRQSPVSDHRATAGRLGLIRR